MHTPQRQAHLSPFAFYVSILHIIPILVNLYISAGFAGSAPIAIGGGSVSDLFSERDRASAMALYTFGPLLGVLQFCTPQFVVFSCNLVLGPAIGPVAGGFITEKLGIKWVFIVLAGSSKTGFYPLSINIIGLLCSDMRCCKHSRDPLLERDLWACHQTETCCTVRGPRSCG